MLHLPSETILFDQGLKTSVDCAAAHPILELPALVGEFEVLVFPASDYDLHLMKRLERGDFAVGRKAHLDPEFPQGTPTPFSPLLQEKNHSNQLDGSLIHFE
jgi:hypothetical protein